LDIFAQDNVLENNQVLAKQLWQLVQRFQAHPHLGKIRQQGMIVALDMLQNAATGKPYPWQERRGLAVYRYALQHGVLLRPLGNVVYFMPPYIITPQQLELMVDVAYAAINHATIE
jgi:adenosylmethionine-8-amino-7-oxononanoate aminotransferase